MPINMPQGPGYRGTQLDLSKLLMNPGAEILKGFNEGADRQAKSNDLKLAALLKGQEADAEKARDSARTQENLKVVEQYMQEHPNQGVALTPGGGVSATPKDPLMSLLRKQQMDNIQEDRDVKRVQGISDRMQKSNIPETMTKLDAIGSEPLKSLGGAKNLIPDWAAGLAEKVGLMPKGSAQERQAFAALQNAIAHAEFGTAQSKSELPRLMSELGRNVGSSAEDMQAALKGVRNRISAEGQNILQGADPRAVARFKSQGGMTDFSAPRAPAQEAPALSFEEFKQLKRSGKLGK